MYIVFQISGNYASGGSCCSSLLSARQQQAVVFLLGAELQTSITSSSQTVLKVAPITQITFYLKQLSAAFSVG